MYLHYSSCVLSYLVLSIYAIVVAPLLAVLWSPPDWVIEVSEKSTTIGGRIIDRLVEYSYRVTAWRIELDTSIRYTMIDMPGEFILIKQEGDPSVLYHKYQGRCFQLWALDGSDGDVLSFHYVKRVVWWRNYSLELEFGWDMPQNTQCGAFRFRVKPFCYNAV